MKRILATGFLLVLAAALGGYSMDHTAGTSLYDREGRLRLFARYGQGAAAMDAARHSHPARAALEAILKKTVWNRR